jgi:hypothetical protein
MLTEKDFTSNIYSSKSNKHHSRHRKKIGRARRVRIMILQNDQQ